MTDDQKAAQASLDADVTTVYFTIKGATRNGSSKIEWHAHRTKRGERGFHHSTHKTERDARAALGWQGGSDDPNFWPPDDYISTGKVSDERS